MSIMETSIALVVGSSSMVALFTYYVMGHFLETPMIAIHEDLIDLHLIQIGTRPHFFLTGITLLQFPVALKTALEVAIALGGSRSAAAGVKSAVRKLNLPVLWWFFCFEY